MQEKDTIYTGSLAKVSDFVFDESVAKVFQDMIQRSVPGYEMILSSISLITARYAQENTHLYDLGCSLGAATLAMRKGLQKKNCHIFGVDNSPAMLERCQSYINQNECPVPVTLTRDDICNVPINNASMVVLNFTLQFIEPGKRLALLNKICKGTNKGGVLILSEKLLLNDEQQQVLEPLQLDYKRANGYSELEISQKRQSIANVLIPETLKEHEMRLKKSGYTKVVRWLQHFNFISLLAIK